LAKKSDHLQLNAAQKEEIRRLTQLANRRIRAAEKTYRKEGLKVLPREVVGEYQIKEKWASSKNPISRSIKFVGQKEYRQQLQMLQRFERSMPSITDYTKVQRDKTRQAIETSLGTDLPTKTSKKMDKLSSPQLSQFWNNFSDKSAKLGVKYSSKDAMEQTISEFFSEDLKAIGG